MVLSILKIILPAKELTRSLTMAGLAIFLLGVGLAVPGAAAEYPVTIATGHPKITLHIRWLDQFFIPEINRRLEGTGNSVRWTRAYGGTAVKLGNEVHAVRDNVVTMSIVPTTLSAAKVPLLQVTVRTPFGSGDPGLVSEAVFRLHERVPELNEMWAKHNIKYLDGGSTATYNILSKRPIDSVDQLQGMTIGVGGPVANWLRGTGAIPVTGTLSQFYNDLRAGVYEAVLISMPSALATRLHEVAPYIGRVNFGAVFSFALVINKDVWESFPPQMQEIFQTVATEWRVGYSEAVYKASDEAIQRMVNEGSTLIDLTGDFRNAVAEKLPNIAREWSSYIENRGGPGNDILLEYMSIIEELGGRFDRNWNKDARMNRAGQQGGLQ